MLLTAVFVLITLLILVAILVVLIVILILVLVLIIHLKILRLHHLGFPKIVFPHIQDLSFGRKNKLTRRPATIAAVIPPAVAFNPPVKIPMIPD